MAAACSGPNVHSVTAGSSTPKKVSASLDLVAAETGSRWHSATQAIARIGEHHRELGEHLNHAVRTGTYCTYAPDPGAGAAWTSTEPPGLRTA